MSTEVKVPTLGESITEATLGQWLKQPGEAVKADEPIASLETDKVAVEVPSPVDGVMGEQVVAEGDNVEVGAVIARIEGGNGAAAKPSAAVETPVNPKGAGENIEVREEARPKLRPRLTMRKASTIRRAASDPVAGGPPRRARASSRSVEDQGHRQGRPPHQGRRADRGQGPRGRSQSRAGPGAVARAARPPPRPRRARRSAGERSEERVRMTPPAPDRRPPPQGGAEHGGDADHLQRRRHVGGDGGAQPLQGPVREEARHPPRLHELLREGGGDRAAATCPRSTPRSTATRSSIATISTSRSRCRRRRAWSCR